jgi:hypothetical protein
VENNPNNRSICQNTADLHLIKSPLKAFESRLFLPLGLLHLTPKSRPDCECEGRFSDEGLKIRNFKKSG